MIDRSSSAPSDDLKPSRLRSTLTLIAIITTAAILLAVITITLKQQFNPLVNSGKDQGSDQSPVTANVKPEPPTVQQPSPAAVTPVSTTTPSSPPVPVDETPEQKLERLQQLSSQQQQENLQLKQRAAALESELSRKIAVLSADSENTPTLSQIEELLQSGQRSAAETELKRFLSSCTNCSLPENIKAFAKEIGLKP